MMDCRHADPLIQRALDGDLNAAERTRLDSHLAGCEECRRAWDDYRRLTQAANAWARPAASTPHADEFFAAQMRAQLAARPAYISNSRQAWGVSAALLAAVVTLLLFAGPHLLSLVWPTRDWLPEPQAALGIPAWLWNNARALPGDLAEASGAALHWRVFPAWATEAFAGVAALSTALLARAAWAKKRRVA